MDNLTLDEAERVLIEKALTRNGGNVSRAADDLGLSRSALYRRLQRFGLAGVAEDGTPGDSKDGHSLV